MIARPETMPTASRPQNDRNATVTLSPTGALRPCRSATTAWVTTPCITTLQMMLTTKATPPTSRPVATRSGPPISCVCPHTSAAWGRPTSTTATSSRDSPLAPIAPKVRSNTCPTSKRRRPP